MRKFSSVFDKLGQTLLRFENPNKHKQEAYQKSVSDTGVLWLTPMAQNDTAHKKTLSGFVSQQDSNTQPNR